MDDSENFITRRTDKKRKVQQSTRSLDKEEREKDAFESFDAVVGELMLKHGIKTSQLCTRVHNIAEAASKNFPPVQVLYWSYNHTFVYSDEERAFVQAEPRISYSDAFSSFVQENPMPDSLATRCALQAVSKFEDEGRVRNVQRISQFGQHLMERWPAIAKLVKAYLRNDLGDRMSDIRMMVFLGRMLLQLQDRRDSIAAVTGRSDGNIEWDRHSCENERVENLSKYAPSALEAMCTEVDVQRNFYTLRIKKRRDALLKHMPEAQYQAMLQSLDTKFPEEIEKVAKALEFQAASFRAHEYGDEKISFIDAITKYGEHHYAVWQCQSRFNEKAMRFLLLHPEYTERLASEGNNVDCALRLGLLAASGISCRLDIKEVPFLVESEVREEYGAEYIHFRDWVYIKSNY